MSGEKRGLVLLVEDEPALVSLLEGRLRREGYETLSAGSAGEAERLLGEKKPDLMLLDYSLPDRDGRQLVESLSKASGGRCLPPFIVTTGRGDERLAVEMMKLGAADYLVKDGEFLARLAPAVDRALERSRLKRELERSREMFRYVFENSVMPKSLTTPDGMVRPNPALCKLLGYGPEELASKNWREITPPEDWPATEKIIGELLSGKSESARFEKRYLRRDGGVVWGDVSVTLRRGEDGRPEYFITAINDITEKKAMEERLREQERRFRSIYENMRDCVAVYEPTADGDFVFVEVNKALERSEGVRREDLVGRRVTEAFPGIGEMGLLEVFRRVSATGEPVAQGPRLYADAAHRGWRDNYVFRLPGGEIVALYTDVTAEMEARNKARESEERNRALLESIPDVVMNLDRSHRHTFVSSNITELGLEAEAFIGKTHRELGFPPELCAQLEAALDKVFATGKPHSVEFSADLPAGRRIFEWRLSPLKADGSVVSVTTAARDITGYRALETDYKLLFDSMLDGFAVHEMVYGADGKPADYRFLKVNKAFGEITGFDVKKTEGRLASEALAGRHADWVKLYAGVVENGAPLRLSRYSPELRKHFDIVAFRNKPGQFATIFRDVTAQVEAAAERELLSQTISASLNEIYIFDADTLRFKFVNRGALKNIGYGEGEIKSLTPLDLKPEMSREEFQSITGRLREGKSEVEQFITRHCRNDGSFYPVEVRLQYEESNNVFLAVIADITERRRAEEELLAEKERFRVLSESSPDAIFVQGNGRFLYLNPAACRLFGVARPEELLGREFMSRIAPEFRGIIKERIRQQRDTGQPVPLMEQRYLRLDGSEVYVEATATPITFKDQPAHLVFVRDITLRKQIRAEADRLAAAMEQAAEMMVITDTQGVINYVNAAFEKVTGYSRAEVQGKKPSLLKSGRQDEAFYRQLWETIKAGGTWSGRMVNRRKDGSLYTEDSIISPVKSPGGEIVNYVAVKRDITEQLRLEEQLRHAQKMESVGLLAGGVAHDFNNLLTGITGYAGMLKRSLPPGDQRLGDLQEILYAAERASELTRQLLIFSRKEAAKPVAMDINEGVRATLRLIGRIIGEDVRLETDLAPEPCVTRMDTGYFSQVLLNLVVNARDAMPKGGTLSIRTRAAAPPAVSGPGAGRTLLLEVEDTGCGMSPEVQARVFEPFFTTKERGKGTGLGLPTVYGIVEQAGGKIELSSAPGKGTRFSIYLPEASVTNREREERKYESPAPGGRGETVLLVEDEERLRLLGQRILESGGYKVTTAASGAEALEKAAGPGKPFDAVVCDLVLPGMNGRELAAELARRGQALRFLYVSGYTDNLISSHGVLEDSVAFMSKPFTPGTLLAKVREVLDGPAEKARP